MGEWQMKVCVPVTDAGSVDPRWGRADRVAIAEITDDEIEDWQEFDVQWSSLHDAASEASHHARVARFLRDHGVEVVVAHHMGPPMVSMLQRMHIRVCLEAGGDARQAALAGAELR
jgi:predicted Fe-Mo cluster-binding NifX family protein